MLVSFKNIRKWNVILTRQNVPIHTLILCTPLSSVTRHLFLFQKFLCRLLFPNSNLIKLINCYLFQIVLSAAWLILMPPKTGAYEQVWRCAPPTTFEEGLVVSLIYVMLLLAITTLFALLTWQCQDNNRESRWICACAILVAVVWLAWTILSTQLSPHYR